VNTVAVHNNHFPVIHTFGIVSSVSGVVSYQFRKYHLKNSWYYNLDPYSINVFKKLINNLFAFSVVPSLMQDNLETTVTLKQKYLLWKAHLHWQSLQWRRQQKSKLHEPKWYLPWFLGHQGRYSQLFIFYVA